MASNKNKTSLPAGFTPVGFSRVDGWYTVKEGNFVQGILEGSFTVKTDLGIKKVFRIQLTKGGTEAIDGDKKPCTMAVGDICGLDQRGFLKPLDSVAEGSEVFIICTGKGKAKANQSPPWTFDIGARTV